MGELDQDPFQRLICDFVRWVIKQNPSAEYWSFLLLDFGLYDPNGRAQDLIEAYRISSSPIMSSVAAMAGNISAKPTKEDITIRFFVEISRKDRDVCFNMMARVFSDFSDGEVDEDRYPALTVLEGEGSTDPELAIENIDLNNRTEEVYMDESQFKVYVDIHNKIQEVKDEVFIVDAYIDKELINLYFSELPKHIDIRVLTKGPKKSFRPVAQKFLKDEGRSLDVRKHEKCHDRLLFVDNRGFLIGNSIKDAGEKPCYFVEINSVDRFKSVFEGYWEDGKTMELTE